VAATSLKRSVHYNLKIKALTIIIIIIIINCYGLHLVASPNPELNLKL
jgi:hypothetical protein